jgi:hypothetical protein
VTGKITVDLEEYSIFETETKHKNKQQRSPKPTEKQPTVSHGKAAKIVTSMDIPGFIQKGLGGANSAKCKPYNR